MSEKKILVIDDSATIRKLVDTHLSGEGYTVILASNAEDGLAYADQTQPDLIILDHQLPGTTGYEVCQRLLASPTLKQIPVVASSTLRKKAYAEYTDCDNVIDMLPKPYTEELLKTTVANALETATMIVASQSQGTAVPEVIEESDDAELSGSFGSFTLRELLDFLNNGGKPGVLEVEAERIRLRFFLAKGRIQGVSATGITADEIAEIANHLPQSLANLAAVLNLTISGRNSSGFDGFVQLLDQKVLDPRLTAKLLRFQAAMLVRLAFNRKLSVFRFRANQTPPSLHRDLPIDSSLLALLVEQALHCDPSELPPEDGGASYVRRSIRGQNLDRAGLAARHMKILNLLSEPRTVSELSDKLGWDEDEVRRVLQGFVLAELVEIRREAAGRKIVIFEPDPTTARRLRADSEAWADRLSVKVVRDELAFRLLVKRSTPDAVVFAADYEGCVASVRDLLPSPETSAGTALKIAVGLGECGDQARARIGFEPDGDLPRPYTLESVVRCVERTTDETAPACPPADSQHGMPHAGDADRPFPVTAAEVPQ